MWGCVKDAEEAKIRCDVSVRFRGYVSAVSGRATVKVEAPFAVLRSPDARDPSLICPTAQKKLDLRDERRGETTVRRETSFVCRRARARGSGA